MLFERKEPIMEEESEDALVARLAPTAPDIQQQACGPC